MANDPGDSRVLGAQVAALTARMDTMDHVFWARIARIESRESEMTASLELLRSEFRADAVRMHQENDKRLTEISKSVMAISLSVGDMARTDAKLEGGVTALRLSWRVLVGLLLLAGFTAPITAERLEMVRRWLFG